MRLIHFKSLLVTASFLVTALLLIMICVTCVSADTVVYEHEYILENDTGVGYDLISSSGPPGYNPEHCWIRCIAFRNPQCFENLKSINVRYTSEMISNWPKNFWGQIKSSEFVESDITYKGSVIGTCTHGYSRTYTGNLSYIIIIHSLDLSGVDNNDNITLATYLTDLEIKNACIYYDDIPEDQIAVGDPYSDTYIRGIGDNPNTGEDYSHYWYTKTLNFQNNLEVLYDSQVNYYTIHIIKDVPRYEGTVSSKWRINDSVNIYINESSYNDTDITTYVVPAMYDDFCDGLDIKIQAATSEFINDTLYDLCDYEIGYVNLSGYTRSIDGNLIKSVELDVVGRDNYALSNEFGWYCFGDDCLLQYAYIPELNETNFGDPIETGSFTLNSNKSGYYNITEDMYIGTSGSYQHDIYMIPLDALDTGEFGGIVYDYCTLEPIKNSYVYLLNKTSGDERYIITNENGFYKFSNLVEDMNYSVRAFKVNYEESVIYDFMFNETNEKTHNIWLLPEGGCLEEPIPTAPPPTPITPTPSPSPIPDIIFGLLGIENGAYLLALLAIGLMAGVFGKFSHFNPIVTALGGFFGFIFSILMEWIPSWLLGVVIVIVAAVIAAMIIKARG